jgi:hypothetical protein
MLIVVLFLIVPADGTAAAPRNDNYLSSLRINSEDGSIPGEFHEVVDTTDATIQADIFNPNADGVPFGGGPPEPTGCVTGPSYGKTVWYDFVLPTPGGVEINAAGFDAAIAIYEWDPTTTLLKSTVACQDDSSGSVERMLRQRSLGRERNYTVQVGGVNGAGGVLDFRFTYFPDTDGDGVLDEQPDECRRMRGIAAFGGCPPVVRGSPRIAYDRLVNGLRVNSLSVDRVTKGSRIEVRCRGCGRRVVVRARRRGTVEINGLVGRSLSPGDRVEMRLTRPRTRAGRYRFGAIGKRWTWPVLRQRLGTRTEHCTRPGSSRRMRCP